MGKRHKKRMLGGLMGLAAAMIMSAQLVAVAANVTKEYTTETPLKAGMLVSAIPDKNATVEPTNLENADQLFGVVVDFDETVIALGQSGTGKVQVAHDGVLDVLVSDLSGAIKKGDLLTASPLSGIAQKATREPAVIGTALSDFDSNNDQTLGTAEATTKGGESRTVKLGKVSVQFEIGANPAATSRNQFLGLLQGIAETIARKPVSPLRVALCVIVLLITMTVGVVLIVSAIRSAMVAIGRNPLSRGAVYKAMIQVFSLVALVMGAGLGTIYIILKT